MKLRTLTARFPGTCDGCGETVAVGDKIAWAKGETYHDNAACRPGATARDHARNEAREYDGFDEDEGERRIERALARRDNSEYAQGLAEGRRRSIERKVYGDALVEAWEMEEEMKHAWDY